jgi:hypothetical protein
MIHCDGHTSSVLDSQNNKTFYNFTVNNYDVIHMKYSGKTKELTMINTRDNEQITLKITNDKNMSMYLSVCMLSQ